MSRFEPGQRVFIPGTALAGGIGVGDDEQIVQIDGNAGFAIVREDVLIDAIPKPLPGHLAVVARKDLQELLSGFASGDARKRLKAVLSPPDVRVGDVWKDAAGARWFAMLGKNGGLCLAGESGMARLSVEVAVTRQMELEWRRPEDEPLHTCEHQASNFTPCKVCGA